MGKYRMLHIMIRVMDLEKSLAFYEDALGLTEVRRKDKPEGKFTLVYLWDGQTDFTLELTYNYDPEVPYDLGNGYGHLALEVDDLEASHDEHIAKGYTVTNLSGLDAGKKSYYFITDPDGYKIEILRKK
ncbi:lactoylglutathione lyase [Eubacterium aggregans]|uniref:lactoylglutathione lyase n=1 Tax=Eubacterium aggregans TaxID=81409 RepID=UPI003F2B1A20